MIKKILLALVMVLPMCVWAQAPKFGIVDVDNIIPQMPEFVEAQNKLSEASAALAVLGYSSQEVSVALKGLDLDLPLEEIVRQGLKRMAKL